MPVLRPMLRMSSLHESEVHHEEDELLPPFPHMLGDLVIQNLQDLLELHVLSENIVLVLRTKQVLLHNPLKVILKEASHGEHLLGCHHLLLREQQSRDSP